MCFGPFDQGKWVNYDLQGAGAEMLNDLPP